jgi:hypothetical protein
MPAQCEALVLVNGKYYPCGLAPAELHHKLTRARGGLILDQHGETYHQMHLCREHHGYAHDHPDAIKGGLLIEGYVTTESDGTPQYVGPDKYLSERYPRAWTNKRSSY